jgi:hypothetical protein
MVAIAVMPPESKQRLHEAHQQLFRLVENTIVDCRYLPKLPLRRTMFQEGVCLQARIQVESDRWGGSGGEAQIKHKEGFDPLMCLPCVNEIWLVRYGAGPSLRTVGLGATVARSF